MSGVSVALLGIRIVVAILLGRAAIAKLADRGSARDGAEQLGLPTRLATPIAAVLPATELAVAIGLLITPVAGVAGLAAAVLFAAFTVLVGVNLGRGRRPDCNCFGSLGAEPIGVFTLVRNLCSPPPPHGRDRLVAWPVARRVPRPHVDPGVGGHRLCGVRWPWPAPRHGCWSIWFDRTAACSSGSKRWKVPSAAVPAARPHRPRALPIGSPAPAINTVTLDETAVALGDLLDGRHPLVLVFVEPRCGACVALGDELALRTDPFTDRRVVVVAHSAIADARSNFGSITAADVLADPAGTTAAAYGVFGTPAAIVVTPDGRVASAISEGRFDVSRLLGGPSQTGQTAISDGKEVVRT